MAETIFKADEHPHIRYNPLKDDWVIVSPYRLQRPWSGQVEDSHEDEIPEFEPTNPLCPGVTRPNGKKNDMYSGTYVFENDYPALKEEVPNPPSSDDPLFQMKPAKGLCKVVCFHPKSNITLPLMTLDEIKYIVDRWIEEFNELSKKYLWVQIFENKGAIMGCSNPHPHCQIWASSFYPNEPRIKCTNQKIYYEKYKRPMLMDYLEKELKNEVRIVDKNDDFVVLVPFWASWPFETMILPRKHVSRINDLDEKQKVNLSKIIKSICTKYDNLFKTSFPYSMGWHGAPTGPKTETDCQHWVFHGVYFPPLLRSATVKKFMVGYELLANVQRDLTPEKAAECLRNQPDIHYKKK